jgi:hypothetical protein
MGRVQICVDAQELRSPIREMLINGASFIKGRVVGNNLHSLYGQR